MSSQPPSATDSNAWPDRKTLSFLLNVGLLGAELQCFDSSRELLTGLQQLRPDLPHVQLLAALLKSRAIGALEARHELLRMVEEFPRFHMASAMLALIDRESRFAGWQGMAESIVESAGDDPAINLARYVLRT